MAGRICWRFRRLEAKERCLLYLKALMAPIERKNSWQLAEFAGDTDPSNFQHFLNRACWEADGLRNDLRRYVVEHLGDPDGVLIVDETGFLKKGTKSVGVQRQYSGTAGRTENCQVGVFLAYASAKGHAFIDRALYLPKSWTDNPQRCREAWVPEGAEFATKIQLARRMLKRAVQAGAPARWVAADALYGTDHRLRHCVEELGLNYVLAVQKDHAVWIGQKTHRVETLVTQQGAETWRILSCGEGSKGPRFYRWTALALGHPEKPHLRRWVIGRRNLGEPDKVAYFLALAPVGTTPEQLVGVIGRRWAIEQGFQDAKGEAGLDQYEVRTWHGWHRHVTLSLLAHAVMTVLRAQAIDVKKMLPGSSGSLYTFKKRCGFYYL
ncbi:IS701 family transposase [Gloeobacter morelensis]|uniref:IS701 family transposase n=1 Tax=Gloeobacter morelensis TaxID=2907343 RepID=UPI00300C92F7